MPKIQYQDFNFRRATLKRIEQANDIIAEYSRQGYGLTLRQLYYQFVARGLIPNTQKSYKALGSIINDARLAGLIDWFSIEDRTRNLQGRDHWNSPAEIVRACANQFHIDFWKNQTHRPEVWVEKEALIGIFGRVCRNLDVPYFACRGYVSQSEQWLAGRRFRSYIADGQIPVVLHFGDHDPSGIDMTRDNAQRLDIFAENEVQVKRLALNLDQVERYNPPPNPAKVTDTRFGDYAARFGQESWELDALEPQVLVDLAEREIRALIDEDVWAESERERQRGRDRIAAVADQLEQEEE